MGRMEREREAGRKREREGGGRQIGFTLNVFKHSSCFWSSVEELFKSDQIFCIIFTYNNNTCV